VVKTGFKPKVKKTNMVSRIVETPLKLGCKFTVSKQASVPEYLLTKTNKQALMNTKNSLS
jgi:hypothetical protein